jgi:exopolyphosphatase/guanosine-5'-triphosphate,3'-diphosphate pyrophosphatase
MSVEPVPQKAETPPADALRPVAVIDIGATAMRLQIAEVNSQGVIRPLESLQRAVPLGKDTFTTGHIEPASIEECVKVLQSFRRVMTEYGVTRPDQVRAVATSAVREAENRDAFLDRIYMATQINVEAIEGAEENRLTYIAVHDVFQEDPRLQSGDAVIIEVGGGSTELIFIREGRVNFARTSRLGSLRMRETLETYRAPADRVRAVLEQYILRAVNQLYWSVAVEEVPYLVAISGDARFAASRVSPRWEKEKAKRMDVKAFANVTDRLVPVPVDDLVRKYRIAYQEAETIGPALLAYEHLARAFHVKEIIVARASLRDGLLREMAVRGAWTFEFAEQAVHAAMLLARKYSVDQEHSLHVADLSVRLFRELQAEHGLEERFELLLRIAALLHEVGAFISDQSHHKHSMYIIQHSELFGLTRADTTLIALVARYHRRAMPRAYHVEYSTLGREDRLTVSKLAAMLRVADALDRKHTQQLRRVSFSREDGSFVITIHDASDLMLEQLALKEKGNLFEQVFGIKAVLRSSIGGEGVRA